jgi:hypothetical protein
MAYNKKKIFEQAKEAITKNNLFFVNDIWAWLPCSRSWFYDAFPDGSDELDTFKGMLEQNKIKTKSSIRAKLFKGEKAAELLALYRLICTPEEHRLLNQQYIETKQIQDKDMTPEETRDFVISTLKELKKRDE